MKEEIASGNDWNCIEKEEDDAWLNNSRLKYCDSVEVLSLLELFGDCKDWNKHRFWNLMDDGSCRSKCSMTYHLLSGLWSSEKDSWLNTILEIRGHALRTTSSWMRRTCAAQAVKCNIVTVIAYNLVKYAFGLQRMCRWVPRTIDVAFLQYRIGQILVRVDFVSFFHDFNSFESFAHIVKNLAIFKD